MSIGLKLLISLILGAVIGLERESYERKIDKTSESGKGSLGVRSFSLITTLGAVAGLVYFSHFPLSMLISVTFMVMLQAYYIIGSLFTRDNGITTELAIVFSYLVGFFVSLNIFPIQLIIAGVIVIVGILSIKERLHAIIAGIRENELSAFLSFAIITLVILPFLPNKNYSLGEIENFGFVLKSFGIDGRTILNLHFFNPFNIWKIVVIITGVDIFGYVLEKTIGQKKGWLLTSLAGGFISSTSTTQTLALKSKTSKSINKLTAAAIFANFSSFIQHFILIASVNIGFFGKSLVYVLLITVSSFILGLFFLNKEEKTEDNLAETKESLQNTKIFSLGPALKFAFIFMCVTILTKVSLALFGEGGFLASTALAAITGLDATTINVSQLAGTGISYSVGLTALIVANAINLGAKSFYSFLQGNRRFAFNFSFSMLLVVLTSLLGLLAVI